MREVQLSAEQLEVIANWSCVGADMATVVLLDRAPAFITRWHEGDVVAAQGDAYVQLSSDGRVKEAVPPVELG